jgi:hypothetical protein
MQRQGKEPVYTHINGSGSAYKRRTAANRIKRQAMITNGVQKLIAKG